MGTTKQSQAQLRPVDLEKYEYVQGIRPDTWMNPKSRYAGSTGARSFDGDQYVKLTTSIAVGSTESCWVSLWVKRASGAGNGYIFYNGRVGGGNGGFYLYSISNDLYIAIDDEDSNRGEGYITSGDLIDADDTWRHIVVVFERGGNATCYLNNTSIGTLSLSSWTGAINADAVFYPGAIGSSYSGSTPHEGDLSKIACGLGTLTPTEITELYNKGEGLLRAEYSSSLAAKTVHSWNCNEAPEELLYDSTGDNHGTPAIPTTNLVSNGTFESVTFGDPDDWTIYQGDGDSYAVMDIDSHAGEMSMKMLKGDGDVASNIKQAGFTEGHYGTLKFWAKAESGTPVVTAYGGAGGSDRSIEITDEWNEYTANDFTIGSDEYIRLRPSTSDVAIWFDDVSFVRTGPDVSSVTTSLELGARTFDGEQYVTLDSAITAPGTNDFWISLWFKGSATGNTQYMLVWGATNDTNPGIRLHLDNGDDLWLSFSDGTDRESVQLEGSWVDGEWHHCILQFDRDGNMSIRVDSDENTATASISSLTASVTPIAKLLGATSDSFNGDLSKIAYGTGLLDTDDIAELYNSGRGITKVEYSSGLAAKTTHSWDCNEGPEDYLYDSTGTNHGTPSLPTTNLVSNGGFEDWTTGDPDDWDITITDTATCGEDSGGDAYDGSSIYVDITTSNVYLDQDVLVSGNTYDVELYAKADAEASYWRPDGGFSGTDFVTIQTSWTKHTWSDLLASSSVFRWRTGGVNSGKKYWFDNVSVVRTGPHVGSTRGPEAQELVTNGGFDSGDNWSTTGCNIADGKVTFTESGQNCDQTGRSFVGGQDYQVTLEIEDYTGRAVALGVGSYGFEDLPIDGNGTWTFTKTAIAPGTILRLRGAAGLEGETIAVTNVSVVRADGLGGRSFDGSQWFELGSDIDPGTSDFWFSAWIKAAASTVYESIFSTGGGSKGTEGVWVTLESGGNLRVGISDGSTQIFDDVSDAALDDNTWHHVAINLDRDGNAQAYVDGVEQTANSDISALNGNSITPTDKPHIGRYASANIYPFHGDLSKIAYGTGLLDTDDIAELYNDGVGITKAQYSTDLAAKVTHSWDCNEGPGDSLYDSTGTNDGTPAIDDSDLVTNGGFEDRGEDDFDDWLESPSGSSTVNAETSDVQTGSVSCRLDVVDGSTVHVGQNILTSGHVYSVTVQAKGSASGPLLRGVFGSASDSCSVTETWGECILSGTSDSTLFRLQRNVGGTYSIYLDNVSVVRTGPHVGSAEGPETAKILDSISTNHGTPVNMDVSNVSDDVPAALAGTGVKSMTFDGTEEYVDCGDPDTSEAFRTALSFAAWVKTSFSGDNIYSYDSGSGSGPFWVRTSNAEFIGLYVNAVGGSAWVQSPNVDMLDGEWHHIAATYESGSAYYYVDGQPGSQVTSVTGILKDTASYEFIGARSNIGSPTDFLNGNLCDPRIYSKALTPTEVAQLYAGTDVTDGLVSRWKFDDNWSEGVSNDDPIVALESRSGNQIYTQPTSSKRPLYIEGPPESIQFDGTNDYLSSSNVITAESGVFAANCYFPSGDYSIISQSKAGSASYYFDIGVSDGIVQVKHENNDSETLVYGETDISNDWHCVVVTSDGSNYGIRVDQHQESLTGDNDGHWFGNLDQKDTLTLGANIIDSTDTPASGNISDVVIFNNPISSGYLMGLEKNMMKIGGFYNG
jgi:hypothetical protein